jgi:hypothetical protein
MRYRWQWIVATVVFGLAQSSCGNQQLQRLQQDRQRLSDELGQARQALAQQREQNRRLEQQLRALKERLNKQRVILEITQTVEKVRGLPLRLPLRVRWVDHAFVKQFVQSSIEQELSPDYIEAYVVSLGRLGLLPVGYPLKRSYMELMGEQGAGFYDPRAKKLFVRQEMPAGEIIMSHEIAHALQDQSFDLRRFLKPNRGNDDREFAVRAVVEGDATLVMVDYLKEAMSFWKAMQMLPDLLSMLTLDDQKLQAAPAYIKETLMRSYLDGLKFVTRLRSIGGWARVNLALRAPPRSSEQILHPEKFFSGEQPEQILIPDLGPLLGSRFKKLHENTLGELGVTVLLGASVADQASSAAEGWGGDRLHAYRRDDGLVLLVWLTRWDTTRDAREFFSAMSLHLEHRYGRAAPSSKLWSSPSGTVGLRTRNKDVVLIDGAADARQLAAIGRACGV